uniref:Transmembrane protein 245 n=1 Tax=Timema monikensis TaxID=170555 RepID=A0A7R9HQK9_9NEOP|nr:unnamed protein product [Timema monikensis]
MLLFFECFLLTILPRESEDNLNTVVTLLIGYILTLAMMWRPQVYHLYTVSSCVMWVLVSCYLANFTGSFKMLTFFIIQLFFLVGFMYEVWYIQQENVDEGNDISITDAMKLSLTTEDGLPMPTKSEQPPEAGEESESGEVRSGSPVPGENNPGKQKPTGLFLTTVATTERRPSKESLASSMSMLFPHSLESDKYLYGVTWGCVLMLLWKYLWVLHLIPIPVSIYIFKHVGASLGLWGQISKYARYIYDLIYVWCMQRKHALFPPSVRGLVKLYAECIHIVQVCASAINSTVVHNEELMKLLPEGWQDKINSVLDDAYVYGREGISNLVRRWLKDVDQSKAVELEQQLLELWDHVYQAWMMSAVETSPVGPSVSSSAVFASWDNVLNYFHKTPELFNVTAIVAFARENLETLMSLVDSLWTLFKGNISLALYSFTAFFSVVFGGGFAVLNFIVNLVVFLTALFYLLSSSGNLYKPFDLITNFSPQSGGRFARALEEAVNGVFKASFKMAVFFGLWTWLVHNFFQVQVVYLPSVLAAIFGAVPFLGTYWAGVPAVLDLWLQDKSIQAALLFLCHFLPCSLVNTAFYKEIKGGGHPYLTGLAIAGGIFCLGVEGAIVGPLVLCGLYVAVNMSSSFMKDSPSEVALAGRFGHLGNLRDFGRSWSTEGFRLTASHRLQ